MAYVAVDDDGFELVSAGNNGVPIKVWMIAKNEYCVVLPKGSIEKLIGRKLTWEDEPVELKE